MTPLFQESFFRKQIGWKPSLINCLHVLSLKYKHGLLGLAGGMCDRDKMQAEFRSKQTKRHNHSSSGRRQEDKLKSKSIYECALIPRVRDRIQGGVLVNTVINYRIT